MPGVSGYVPMRALFAALKLLPCSSVCVIGGGVANGGDSDSAVTVL